MGRVVLTILVPLLLPTAFYLLWRLSLGRPHNLSVTWLWLLLAGLALAVVTLIVISIDFREPSRGTYVPPHVSDGKVVPGRVEPGADAPAPAR
jgi:hypothetical protein